MHAKLQVFMSAEHRSQTLQTAVRLSFEMTMRHPLSAAGFLHSKQVRSPYLRIAGVTRRCPRGARKTSAPTSVLDGWLNSLYLDGSSGITAGAWLVFAQ